MIRVLYIVSTLKLSGPSNQLYNIIKNLDRKHFEPYIITLSTEPERSRMSDFIEMNIKIHSLKLSRLVGFILINTKIRKILSQIKPDIIHTQGIRADKLSGLRLSKKYKTVATLRNYPFEDYPMKFGKMIGKFMAIKHLKAIRRIHDPISCSKSISDILIAKHGIKIPYIQNGVDQSIFFPVDSEQKGNIRRRMKLPENKTIYISVGSLIERKNNTQIINEFMAGIADLGDAILIILGSGPQYLALSRLTAESENIFLPGIVSNVPEYLQLADLYISASYSEGLPNTVLEAMACGLPVILSEIPQHKEIVSYNSNAGIFFPLDKKSFMRDVIVEIKKRGISEMQNASIEIISKYLGANRMSEQYQTKYINLATSHEE